MSYKVKVFSYPDVEKTESEVNKWLAENNLKDVQIIPSIAITAAVIPTVSPSLGGRLSPALSHPTGALQVQAISAFSITVVYREKSEVRS